MAYRSPAWLLPVLLSFVAAYADTVGFVALFGLFTAHVTGNFILLGAMLVEHTSHGGLFTKLLALPVFMLAVAATTLLVRARERAGRPSIRLVVAGEALLLAGFLAAGLAASPVRDPDAPLAVLAGAFGLLAMGVQNAAARLNFAKLSPTTVMTGNVTQAVIDAVDLLLGRGDAGTTRERIRKLWPPVLAFFAGAIAGGVGFLSAGFACLLLPLAALALVGLLAPRAV